jgi:hypothetical protein
MNELAMNLATERIDDTNLKLLIVAQTIVAKFQSEDSAMGNRFGIGLELNPDPIPHRDAIFHIEKELLHCIAFARAFKRVGVQPMFVPEEQAKRRSGLSKLVSFQAARQEPGKSQNDAPFLDKLGNAETLRIGLRRLRLA